MGTLDLMLVIHQLASLSHLKPSLLQQPFVSEFMILAIKNSASPKTISSWKRGALVKSWERVHVLLNSIFSQTQVMVSPRGPIVNSPAYKFGSKLAEDTRPGTAHLAVAMGKGGGGRGVVVRWGLLVSCGSLLAGVESASARHPSGEVGTVSHWGNVYVLSWGGHNWCSLVGCAVFWQRSLKRWKENRLILYSIQV